MKYFYLLLTSLLIPLSASYASLEESELQKREAHSTQNSKKNSEVESLYLETKRAMSPRESILKQGHEENGTVEMKGSSSLESVKSTFENFLISLMGPEEYDQVRRDTTTNCFEIDLPERGCHLVCVSSRLKFHPTFKKQSKLV